MKANGENTRRKLQRSYGNAGSICDFIQPSNHL